MYNITAQTLSLRQRVRANTERRAGTLRPHVEACKVWPLSVEVPVWHSEASPNEPAEHKRKLGKSRTSCSVKEERRTEAGSGGGVCDAGGMWATPALLSLLSEPGRAFLSLNQRADSLPKAAVCVGRGGRVLGEGVLPRRVPCWMAQAAKVRVVLLGKGPSVYWLCMSFFLHQFALGQDLLGHPCCSSQRLKDRLWDMWTSGLASLGIGEGVSVQRIWPTPVINAILLGTRRSILLFH